MTQKAVKENLARRAVSYHNDIKPILDSLCVACHDAPGVAEFYYRLRPIDATIVEKTHFVYELSNDKMRRYDELFCFFNLTIR